MLLSAKSVKIGLVAVCLAFVAAGCGRRGPLEAPPNGRVIPGEENAQPEDQPSNAISNPIGQAPRRSPPIKPPSGPFALDFLL